MLSPGYKDREANDRDPLLALHSWRACACGVAQLCRYALEESLGLLSFFSLRYRR
jgi:hypothetical protein